jgi:seipin
MPGIRFLGQAFNDYRQRTASEIREFLLKAGVFALVTAVIIWVSVFLYVAFYYTYMPLTSHVRPVHLQFK